jgi:hypothetical protein
MRLGCHYFRAGPLTAEGRLREALADWDRFLALAPPAMRTEGRFRRADVLARLGDHRQAAPEARALARLKGWGPGLLYDLACLFSLCSAAAAKDANCPLPLREREAEAHARQAVAVLRRAADAGYFSPAAARAHLAKDPDLDNLRRRADFRAFVAGLAPRPGGPAPKE